MPGVLKLRFAPFSTPAKGVLVLFCEEGLKFGAAARKALNPTGDLITRAAAADRFKGKNGSALNLVAPAGLDVSRLIIVGVGKPRDLEPRDFAKLGGIVVGRIPSSAGEATIVADLPGGGIKPDRIADIALGARLRGYAFERYKTKRKEGEEKAAQLKVTIAVAGVAAVEKAFAPRGAVAGGVAIARDLVNEPANVLYPEEFARRAGNLKKLGVVVDVLDVKEMKKLGMNALIGVGLGSQHESRTVIMRWNGGKRGAQPVAFIGKGVCFDTGGISIKPAAGMEDMKGDMAGAACVVGLMHALASRKAKCNVIGAIGIVENMPDGKAQRPGDIVKSMSGQTIEIINTDAEGRLVLADALALADEEAPDTIITFATLSGAARVALGADLPPLFCDDDALAGDIHAAGLAVGDPLWRMPFWPGYERHLDSDVADLNNVYDSPFGGAITAALFLRRFVAKARCYAHIDMYGWRQAPRALGPKGGEAHAARAVFEALRRRHSAT
jgi:leucyl aminopeptidase